MKSKLRALAQEYRNGSRDGSFMEPLTPATTGQDSHIGWSQLANDLEEVGIPRDVIKKNWGFFVAWLEEAMSNQSPEPERTPVLDRLWPDNNTEDPQEETEQKCTFCNSSYHDTAQHELFGSESLALTLTPSTVSDATSRSNSTNPSFFDRLGSNGYSIEVGFGGADPPKRLSPGTGNDVSSKNADRSIQHRRSSSDKRKDAKTKSRKSFLSTFGSSSPSLAQVRSPFGGESAMSINHVRPELGRISGEDVSIINESIR